MRKTKLDFVSKVRNVTNDQRLLVLNQKFLHSVCVVSATCRVPFTFLLLAGIVCAAAWCQPLQSQTTEKSKAEDATLFDFFETKVRPILANKCFECHSEKKNFHGLRLDTREGAMRGGDTGKVIDVRDPAASLLYQAIARTGDLKMPPDDPLSNMEVMAIRQWIEMGAPWPIETQTESRADREQTWSKHWAFQPVERRIPPIVDSQESNNPIDTWVHFGHEKNGLQMSPMADRRTLVRRLTLDLTGLPPSIDDIRDFENDREPDAYERLVERLLASPAYGHNMARDWLDVARYSDTKGYVYAREERFFIQAPAYRNWVIEALNVDLPYNRFLELQIAADQVDPNSTRSLAAMGFLTLGRRFLGVTHDILDDRIDVVSRGTLGLTVACARCHDHKYDPIPTSDYYSLYGVFMNCTEQQVEMTVGSETNSADSLEYQKELQQRIDKLNQKLKTSRDAVAQRTRSKILEYLLSQSELHRYPEEGFDTVLSTEDLIPTIVRRWEGFFAGLDRDDSLFGPWLRYVSFSKESFSKLAAESHATLLASEKLHARIRSAFEVPPTTLEEAARCYAKTIGEADREIQALHAKSEPIPADLKAFEEFLYGVGSPCIVPDEEIVSNEFFFDSGTVVELWKLQGEVDRWRLKNGRVSNLAVALVDRTTMTKPRVFRRGNPANKGEYIERHFLTHLSNGDPKPFREGSGRKELAQAIIDPRNPLTARVWVNRLWQHHFGDGIVRTASDFGIRAPPPLHPELLDWLATELIASGWSTKHIQRLIVSSRVYRQGSLVDSPESKRAMQRDPDNRWMWRFPPRRLRLEELRDSLLKVSGDLDERPASKSEEMFGPKDTNFRRTIYGLVDRQFLSSTLRMFDFANPDLHIARRSETQIPQQSLFMMNHAFMAWRARSLIEHLSLSRDNLDSQNIEKVFEAVLQRAPSELELQNCKSFLDRVPSTVASGPSVQSVAWSYGYGEIDVAQGKLKNFQSLPYFASNAWQGGPNYPDKSLGWVQLTASGGHPGNDLKHASIRRWKADRAMTIAIRSVANHEPDVGDGIRCWILSSRQGVLSTVNIRASKKEMNVETLDVQAGETIDFVVDILEGLNSDQYIWSPEIRSEDRFWNASKDFVGPMQPALKPLELLAQALMMSNEVAFID